MQRPHPFPSNLGAGLSAPLVWLVIVSFLFRNASLPAAPKKPDFDDVPTSELLRDADVVIEMAKRDPVGADAVLKVYEEVLKRNASDEAVVNFRKTRLQFEQADHDQQRDVNKLAQSMLDVAAKHRDRQIIWVASRRETFFPAITTTSSGPPAVRCRWR